MVRYLVRLKNTSSSSYKGLEKPPVNGAISTSSKFEQILISVNILLP